ncbi:MAG: glycosyltransferase family 9 protein [Bdellovibrionales bacterium]|nr:glycosyltransferase family 9 protein [Bdellovibrionales bacterium]
MLIVHLEALGAVLRSTSLLAAVHRQFPRAHVTWVTKAPAQHLLAGVPGIDRVLTIGAEDLLALSALSFDVALVIDKSLVAAGVLAQTQVGEVRGFRTDRSTGAIVPANSEAHELWHLGLSDQKKFFENKKTEQHLVHEALALGAYARDEYVVELNPYERETSVRRREQWAPFGTYILGINTGCSPTLPAKKLSVEGTRLLIHKILADDRFQDCRIVLLGGPEDSERNTKIAQGLPVVESPTDKGLRDGLASMAACDLVFSGDSLGMHMAIGLRKWVVAWFGPSCEQEIDLYDRGVKILTSAPCSPCWKRDCQKSLMCYDQVDFDQTISALAQGRTWLTSYSKPHSLETFFSPSP